MVLQLVKTARGNRVENRQYPRIVSIQTISAAILFFCYYKFSVWLLTYYIAGDLFYYQHFWDYAGITPLSEIPDLQRRTTGSREPLYGLFVYLLSGVFDRTFVISLVNGVFALQIFNFLRKYNVSAFIYPLVFTNFYFLVLIGPAERLKLAAMFFLLAFELRGMRRNLALGISPLFHLQGLIGIGLFGISRFVNTQGANISRNGKMLRRFSYFAGALILVIGLGILLQGGIVAKFTSYSDNGALEETLYTVGLMAIAYILFDNKIEIMATFLPLVILSFLVGGARINMLAFVAISYLFIKYSKSRHPVFLILLGYFSFRSIEFVNNISEFGTAFL